MKQAFIFLFLLINCFLSAAQCTADISTGLLARWDFSENPVNAFAGNDTIAVKAEQHQLFATGGVSYSWEPSNLLNF